MHHHQLLNLLGSYLMALILSPTDAALGQAVVQSEAVPISIRQSHGISAVPFSRLSGAAQCDDR